MDKIVPNSKSLSYLLIVESPGKIKKIQSYLPPNYIVAATVGHIQDLDKKNLSVDIQNNFKPTYVIYPEKKKVVTNLKNLAENKIVLIASDLDYEGEFIAKSVHDILKLKEYKRIIFNEITKEAINNALLKPTKLDNNKIFAQQTRRILDRIVGYRLSPLLNQTNLSTDNNYLAAGRVQSVIVKLLVDQDNKIKEFFESDNVGVYEFYASFKLDNIDLYCGLHDINKKKCELDKYNDAKKLIIKLSKYNWLLNNVENKIIYQNPTAPFITSSLQQHASSKLHLNVKLTMQIAQILYENGYITYMRTDCPILSEDAHKQIKSHVIDNYGSKYYNYKQYTSKNKNAQEAHEAIRPSNINILDASKLGELPNKLYQLIWKKTVSSQMSKAEIKSTIISIKSKEAEYLFIGKINNLIFDGFLKVYQDDDLDYTDDCKNEIDNIVKNDKTKIILNELKCKESISHPPSRFNEASLVKKLEQLGIGRPSTYASMIDKIQSHNYASIKDITGIEKSLKEINIKLPNDIIEKTNIINLGKENKRIVPTELGTNVTNFLIKHFNQIMDYQFTAKLEENLDEIANGKVIWYTVLKEFNDLLDNQITDFEKNNQIIKKVYISNQDIVGMHPTSKENILYLKTKFGFAIKMQKDGKDIFVSVDKKPTLEEAIELFDNKKPSLVIKTIGKYQIKNGPYGPYIQTKIGKGLKFYSLKNQNPDTITIKECDAICKIAKIKK